MLSSRYSIDTIFSNTENSSTKYDFNTTDEWELPYYLQSPKPQETQSFPPQEENNNYHTPQQNYNFITPRRQYYLPPPSPNEKYLHMPQHQPQTEHWLPPETQDTSIVPINTAAMAIIPRETTVTQNYCDITKFLCMPQSEAATMLGIPTSTLSKRWKEAVNNSRKWPWRNICKIDREITNILQDMPPNAAVPASSRNRLAILIRNRKEELRPVVIRL